MTFSNHSQVIGLRVVRGPDWKWPDQDLSEGHVGTVVEVGSESSNSPERTVVVVWDHGIRTNYRGGYHHACDLRVLDPGPTGVQHTSSLCAYCHTRNITGFKWRCCDCLVDLCSSCYFNDRHSVSHAFLRFDRMDSEGVMCPKRFDSVKVMSKGIFPGAKVTRGVDWDWDNQDGGNGKAGKVQSIKGWEEETYRSVASVMWPNNVHNVYRVGHKGKMDLKCIKETNGGYYYREHLPVLDLHPSNENSIDRAIDTTITHQFAVGERVKVSLEPEVLRVLQEGHGGWNPKMIDVIDKIGYIHRLTGSGDVRVLYNNGDKWTFHAAALSKVSFFNLGDQVIFSTNLLHLKESIVEGASDDNEIESLVGKIGQIEFLDYSGTVGVVVGNRNIKLKPHCLHSSYPITLCSTNIPSTSQLDPIPSTDIATSNENPMNAGAMSCEESLLHAIESKDRASIRTLLLKFSHLTKHEYSGIRTALHHATTIGDKSTIESLLSFDFDVNACDRDGDTPLHIAVYANNIDVCRLLLERYASPNTLNRRGYSALHISVNRKLVHIAMLLLYSKADLNLQDIDGNTPLFESIGRDNTECFDLLISQRNVDLSITNKNGITYVHQAAIRGDLHALEVCLSKAPDLLNQPKLDSFTALHIAAVNNHPECVKFLISKGAKVNALTNKGVNALMLAVSKESFEIIEELVPLTDLNQVDCDGNNVLVYAVYPRTSSPSKIYKDLLSPQFVQIEQQLCKFYKEVPRVALLACYLIKNGVDYDKQRNSSKKLPLEHICDSSLYAIINSYIDETCKSVAVVVEDCRMCSKPANSRFQPCGHVLACMDCAGCFKKCYLCKNIVEKIEELSLSPFKLCAVCDEVAASVSFEPCGHKVVCPDCAIRMKKCIRCQSHIERKTDQDGNPVKNASADQELCQLRSRLEEVENHTVCAVCLERPKNTAFLCGHATCNVCAFSMTVCPICRQNITQKIKLY